MMMSSDFENQEIRIGFRSDLLDYGIRRVVSIRPFRPPHVALTGSTGSGKTYAEQIMIDRILRNTDTEVLFCDFKGIDFRFLNGCSHFYNHSDVIKALDYAVDVMNARMAGDQPVDHAVYFIIDEWAAFISLLPKKEAEAVKQKMASLLMLGRGLGIVIFMSSQRMDMTSFGAGGSRENISNYLALGNLSRESKQMICPDPEQRELLLPQGRGRGYLITDGKAPVPVVIPRIRDMEGMRRRIRCAMEMQDKRFPICDGKGGLPSA